jgi:hypothetical protein
MDPGATLKLVRNYRAHRDQQRQHADRFRHQRIDQERRKIPFDREAGRASHGGHHSCRKENADGCYCEPRPRQHPPQLKLRDRKS